MNCRDKKLNFRPESVKITNCINEALTPIMKRALKMGLSLDAFYYLVGCEVNDMVCTYALEHRNEN